MANILIVEDDEISLELASELLEHAGHNIIRAENAQQCFKEVKANNPDIILIDINLPETDGLTITQALKKDPLHKNIKIIAFTAMIMPSDKEKAFNSGCCGFISKPINASEFVFTVESFLDNKSSYAETGKIKKSLLFENIKLFPQKNNEIQNKFSSHKILIIEDNLMNAELLKETLTQIGPLVTHARDGRQALKILEGERFDLIMLDIMMPDMSGFEIIKKIKANPKTVDLPVIFVSALDKTSDIVKGFDLGSYQYIVKPFNVEELKARVKSTLKIKDLQDQLSSEKKVLDLIFQFSTDGIVLLNSNFEILSCNEAFLKWIQRKKEEVFQKNFFQVFKCESNGQNPENYFMNRVDKLSHFDFDLTAVLENGKKFLHVNCSPIFSSLVVIEGYILVIRDVTTFREIDAQKETFVATLSHDLKTPIRAQIKAINLLLGKKYGNLNDFQEDILSETLNSNKFMFNMLDNLLTTYKYENGSVRMYKQNYDVNSLIMDCIRELKYLLDDKNLQLIFSFEEKNLEAFIDIIEFKRVIINLLSNAINYTNEKGKIIIKTEKRDFESVISFIDNGRGMSEEEIGKVFSRYSSYAKKFRQVGTGLGLYLSKQIVEKHGGKISVESQEGKGSIFKIILQ